MFSAAYSQNWRFILNHFLLIFQQPSYKTKSIQQVPEPDRSIPSHEACPALDTKNKRKVRQVEGDSGLGYRTPPPPGDRVPRRALTPAADAALARLCLLLVHQPQTTGPSSRSSPVPFLRRGGWNSGSNALAGAIGFGCVLTFSFVSKLQLKVEEDLLLSWIPSVCVLIYSGVIIFLTGLLKFYLSIQ